MNYMLLWSEIERFYSLNLIIEKQKGNNERFAKKKAFKEGIKKYEKTYHTPVYSTDDLKIHEFNANDPVETLYYYIHLDAMSFTEERQHQVIIQCLNKQQKSY